MHTETTKVEFPDLGYQVGNNHNRQRGSFFRSWIELLKNSVIGYQFKNPNFYLLLFADTLIFGAACIASYLIRFEFALHPHEVRQIILLLPFLIPLKLGIFFCFGVYRGMWRYTSIVDLWHLLRVTFMITVIIFSVVYFYTGFKGYSRMVFVLDGLLTFLLAGGLRISIRNCYSNQDSSPHWFSFLRRKKVVPGKSSMRTLIVGAGNAGEYILREICKTTMPNYHVIGFLDDDVSKRGRSIHGRRVLGTIADLTSLGKKYKIEMALIAIPSARTREIKRIVQICDKIGVKYRTLPSLTELIDGKVSVSDFRKINYQDLLGRSPVELNWENISDYLTDKMVLVTGAGGSIGSELCRQILRFKPKELIIVDASEENLFKIQSELRFERNFDRERIILSRVQNRALMEKVFEKYRPQVVFHAAANKHVPMMEVNPWEAVYNNIKASLTAMELAVEFNTERFVLVSTDKAVRPTNVMGASKRVTELLLLSFQETNTKFMAVRFGNVIGSSGSVIPLFERQLRRGGPIRVTHPEVTRYFMTIPEASQLILQAGSMGKGGEIFILDMGKPVRISDLAKDLIRLSGKEPGKDIDIVYTGLREGEKTHEELIMDDENSLSTVHPKIAMLKTNGNICGFQRPEDLRRWLCQKIEELDGSALKMDSVAIKRKLKEIVSEYSPQETTCVL